MLIPKVKAQAEFRGYVRGYYDVDNEKLNKLIESEVLECYPYITEIDAADPKNKRLLQEINEFITQTAKRYAHIAAGEMHIERNDTDTNVYISLQ